MVNGIEVIASHWAVRSHTVDVPRTWRERWLTRPWQPWVRVRTETRHEPSAFLYRGKMYVHPDILRRIGLE